MEMIGNDLEQGNSMEVQTTAASELPVTLPAEGVFVESTSRKGDVSGRRGAGDSVAHSNQPNWDAKYSWNKDPASVPNNQTAVESKVSKD